MVLQLIRKYVAETGTRLASVFWINARDEQSLRLGLASVATKIPLRDVLGKSGALPGNDNSVTLAVEAVMAWFSNQNNSE